MNQSLLSKYLFERLQKTGYLLMFFFICKLIKKLFLNKFRIYMAGKSVKNSYQNKYINFRIRNENTVTRFICTYIYV